MKNKIKSDKKNKSLFVSLMTEFIMSPLTPNSGKYGENPYASNPAQDPFREHIEKLLSSLPELDMIEKLGEDMITLKVLASSQGFESPSMGANIESIQDDVLIIKEKLRAVVHGIFQLSRDLNIRE